MNSLLTADQAKAHNEAIIAAAKKINVEWTLGNGAKMVAVIDGGLLATVNGERVSSMTDTRPMPAAAKAGCTAIIWVGKKAIGIKADVEQKINNAIDDTRLTGFVDEDSMVRTNAMMTLNGGTY